LATDNKRDWSTLAPFDLTGVVSISQTFIADDGISYAYYYNRVLNELYLAYNLR
jgi:hypothetical protein